MYNSESIRIGAEQDRLRAEQDYWIQQAQAQGMTDEGFLANLLVRVSANGLVIAEERQKLVKQHFPRRYGIIAAREYLKHAMEIIERKPLTPVFNTRILSNELLADQMGFTVKSILLGNINSNDMQPFDQQISILIDKVYPPLPAVRSQKP